MKLYYRGNLSDSQWDMADSQNGMNFKESVLRYVQSVATIHIAANAPTVAVKMPRLAS
jgi:hypothetical protein